MEQGEDLRTLSVRTLVDGTNTEHNKLKQEQ